MLLPRQEGERGQQARSSPWALVNVKHHAAGGTRRGGRWSVLGSETARRQGRGAAGGGQRMQGEMLLFFVDAGLEMVVLVLAWRPEAWRLALGACASRAGEQERGRARGIERAWTGNGLGEEQ